MKKKDIILGVIIICLIVISIFLQHKINVYEQTFDNIHICLQDDYVKNNIYGDLYGSYINDEGKLECVFEIGNGLVERRVLE